jgi:hypothetical protein
MSIPLDRLYNYLHDLIDEDIIIYRWTPHGSKNLVDLRPMSDFHTLDRFLACPFFIAHDQEPLDYDYYESQRYVNAENFLCSPAKHRNLWNRYQSCVNFFKSVSVLRRRTNIWNIYDKWLLIHSEKNSDQLTKFDAEFIGVYYWSHAIIARDWFRFAKHDRSLINAPDKYKHDFLIYNRAWTGTREYRLKFTELLIENNLIDCSSIKFSPYDGAEYYAHHQFKNPKFQISNFSMHSVVPENNSDSSSSADYMSNDYNDSGIEIVLETLFDDTRNHLTEKILRSIACGKPFILLSTPGSLQYLRDYGFKTFDGLIDESYDKIQDPLERLEAVVTEMKKIKNLNPLDKIDLFTQLNKIAEYNKLLFFSDAWEQSIVDEFVSNVNHGLSEVEKFKNANNWNQVKEIVNADHILKTHLRDLCYSVVKDTNEDIIDKLNKLADNCAVNKPPIVC